MARLRIEGEVFTPAGTTLQKLAMLDPKQVPATALTAEHLDWNANPKFCDPGPLYRAELHTKPLHRFQSNVAPCEDARRSRFHFQRMRHDKQGFKLAAAYEGHGGNGPIKVWVVDKNGRRRWEM